MIEIWADGSADRDGFGGWAFVLRNVSDGVVKNRREGYGALSGTTNNRMEQTAVLQGLRALKKEHLTVVVFSDSRYVVGAFAEGWLEKWVRKGRLSGERPVPNADLWDCLAFAADAHQVSWELVPGHSGVKENERCDVLAGEARLRLRAVADRGEARRRANRNSRSADRLGGGG